MANVRGVRLHPDSKSLIPGLTAFHNATGSTDHGTWHTGAKDYQRTQHDGIAEMKAARKAAKRRRNRQNRKARQA